MSDDGRATSRPAGLQRLIDRQLFPADTQRQQYDAMCSRRGFTPLDEQQPLFAGEAAVPAPAPALPATGAAAAAEPEPAAEDMQVDDSGTEQAARVESTDAAMDAFAEE